jgi:hypothetical protein
MPSDSGSPAGTHEGRAPSDNGFADQQALGLRYSIAGKLPVLVEPIQEGLLEEWKDDLIRLAHVCNSEQLTEDAAVGVMSLLVHALEGARDLKVVPIGSGGDYLVYVEGEELLIEVSGLDNPDRPGRCSQRLREKTAQVLSKRSVGFVSITTFRYPNSTDAHSYLHFVVRPETMDNQKKPRSRKRK